MKQLVLKYYSDAAHGWIAVKKDLLISLGLESSISAYSYQSKSGSTIYLEEDCDASRLIKGLKDAGLEYSLQDVYHGDRSYIRSLKQYDGVSK